MKELLVSLGLELNQPSRRIIQIGAVVGNIRTGEIVSRFDSKVSPDEELSPAIAKLTKIKQEEVDFGSRDPSLSRAIAWRTAALQSSLPRRLRENDAWIAATALSCEATLIGRERGLVVLDRRSPFTRVVDAL